MSPQICHHASSKLFLGTIAQDTHTHTRLTPPETDEMPWENGVACSPPGVSATPCDTNVPLPPLHALLFHHKAQVCVYCAVTDFWGAICPAAALSGPLVLRPTPPPPTQVHTHTHASILLQRRPLPTHTQGSEHAHYPHAPVVAAAPHPPRPWAVLPPLFAVVKST